MVVSLKKVVYITLLIFHLKLACISRVEAAFGYPTQLKYLIRTHLERNVMHVLEKLHTVPHSVTRNEVKNIFELLINEINTRSQLSTLKLPDYWLLRQG